MITKGPVAVHLSLSGLTSTASAQGATSAVAVPGVPQVFAPPHAC